MTRVVLGRENTLTPALGEWSRVSYGRIRHERLTGVLTNLLVRKHMPAHRKRSIQIPNGCLNFDELQEGGKITFVRALPLVLHQVSEWIAGRVIILIAGKRPFRISKGAVGFRAGVASPFSNSTISSHRSGCIQKTLLM